MKAYITLPLSYLMLSVLFQTASAGFGKQAALTIQHFTILAVITNPFYLLSLMCLGLHAVTWQLALRTYPLGFAYFFMSSTFIGVLVTSALIFHEHITMTNALGTALIVIGIIVITRTHIESKKSA